MTKANTISVGPLSVSEVLSSGQRTGAWRVDIPPHHSQTGKRRRVILKSKTAALTEARIIVKQIELDRLSPQSSGNQIHPE